MKRMEQMIFGCMLFATAAAIGQTESTPQQTQAQPQTATRKARPADSGRGERVFHQKSAFAATRNQKGFSPGISRTIATHMRVRAGLSDPDVKAILEYLNP